MKRRSLIIGTLLTCSSLIFFTTDKIKAESAVFHYNNAVKKQNIGDYYGAFLDYDKALKINPNLWQAYMNRGNLKNRLKEYSGAISDYDKGIEINPSVGDFYANRSVAKWGLRDYQGACIDARKGDELGSKVAALKVKRFCNFDFE